MIQETVIADAKVHKAVFPLTYWLHKWVPKCNLEKAWQIFYFLYYYSKTGYKPAPQSIHCLSSVTNWLLSALVLIIHTLFFLLNW